MIFKIDFKLLSLLILGFVLATVVGTVSHEYGHFFIARYYGLEARVHYGFTSWQRPEGLPQLNRFDHFLINLGGPVQTMVIGSCGLFLMYWNRKSFLKNIPLSFIQWIMVYVSLFWLRFPFNFCIFCS